jgi:hypothetical protein
VRVLIPRIETDGELRELVDGMSFGQDSEDIRRWAERHIAMIRRNQRSRRPYDPLWSKQRIEDIQRVLETGLMLEVEDKKRIAVNRIVMEPDTYHTVFLVFDRPPEGIIGQAYDIVIRQLDVRREDVIGGLSARIELVPEPQS